MFISHHFHTFFAGFSLLQLCAARAVWIPEELQHDTMSWVPQRFSFPSRRADTCGGDSSLTQCGGSFPTDFCCGAGAQCLLLNTTSTITAALCCPAGQDCQAIAPIDCNQDFQNATAFPNSELHSDPTFALQTCGTACCPMGYSCDNNACRAETTTQAATSSTTPASTVTLATATGTSSSITTASASQDGATVTPIPIAAVSSPSKSGTFSGTSFAAGFVPGIFLGALAAAGLVLFMLRKERRKSQSYVDEKHYSTGRDTLTDLGPANVYRQPTFHGRSISEPTADPSVIHRTDFLNSSPPRNEASSNVDGVHTQLSAKSPYTTSTEERGQPQQSTGWFSHSPFVNQAQTPVPTQSPVPTHMKRGTLSFQISPVRALRKQRSMHSLRRHITNASTKSNSARRNRGDLSRTGSTETIKVLMDTPSNPPTIPGSGSYKAIQNQARGQASTSTWDTTDSNSDSEGPTPIETEPNTYTPTKPGRNSNVTNVGALLQSPYTPSNYKGSKSEPKLKEVQAKQPEMLFPPPAENRNSWRLTAATTFEGMMEKAGFRRTLLMGPDPRAWNK